MDTRFEAQLLALDSSSVTADRSFDNCGFEKKVKYDAVRHGWQNGWEGLVGTHARLKLYPAKRQETALANEGGSP